MKQMNLVFRPGPHSHDASLCVHKYSAIWQSQKAEIFLVPGMCNLLMGMFQEFNIFKKILLSLTSQMMD